MVPLLVDTVTPPFCPCSVTPSQKYTARSNRGEVVASFGSVQGPSWSGRGGRSCTPKLFGSPEENLTKSYKYMFQKALDVREGDATTLGGDPHLDLAVTPFLGRRFGVRITPVLPP